jgi:predicted DsbA family dithiol-disulfide isomerase
MIKNANLVTETSERMARLESNEHLNTIMMQYMAKGMTPEEARSQAQGDIENQLQKERQTILQAQKDGAELENQITQWGANASDVIGQAKKSNINQSTTNALQKANMLTSNESATQNVEDQAFTNTVQQVGLENFKTMTDLEKQKALNVLGINQANKDTAFGVSQFLSTMGDYAKTKPAAFAAALKRLNEGKINLQQAQSELFNYTKPSVGT